MSPPLQASLVPLVDILDQVHRAIHRDALGHQDLQEEDYEDARHARELKLWDGLASGKVQAFLVNIDGETFEVPKVQWSKDAQFRRAARDIPVYWEDAEYYVAVSRENLESLGFNLGPAKEMRSWLDDAPAEFKILSVYPILYLIQDWMESPASKDRHAKNKGPLVTWFLKNAPEQMRAACGSDDRLQRLATFFAQCIKRKNLG